MRHVAVGRHERYPLRPSRLSYILIVLAAIAAIIAALVLASQPGPAQARPAANQAPVTLSGRGAGTAVADDPGVRLARAKTVAARLAAVRARAAVIAAALTYTVKTGDSISSVALRHCGASRDWTGIYAASRARGWTAANANVIGAGQHLWLSCFYRASMLRFAPAPAPPAPVVRAVATVRPATAVSGLSYGHPNFCGDGDGDGWDRACGSGGSRASAPARGYQAPARSTYHSTYHRSYAAASSTYHGGSGYQACVIQRESGGNSQVMNSSGHYGLYQFDYGTWVSGGGSGGTFGHASVSEQNRVFAAVYAARGTQPWSPSDGC